MCYSERASYVALGACVAGCGALVAMGQPALAAFFGYAGLMQAFDVAFWRTQGACRATANAALTKAAMLVNHLQPVVLAGVVVAFGQPLRALSAALLAAYAAYAAFYTAATWRRIDRTRVAPLAAPGLFWEWNYAGPYPQVMYGLFVASICATLVQHVRPLAFGVLVAALSAATFVLSLAKYKARSAVGRFWCYMGAFLPVIAAAAVGVHTKTTR